MKKTYLIVGAIIVVLVAVACIFIFVGKQEPKEEGIVGKWEYSSFIYTFNNDKTGNYDALGTIMNFTYEDDGEKLSILYDGNTSPTVLNYRIEGNKLIITDSFGNDVEYTKSK